MISSSLQLYSWFISLIIGAVYYYINSIFIFRFKPKLLVLRLIYYSIFVFIVSFSLIYIYYKINNGYIHYSYPIFWIIGYYISFKVKSYVNLHIFPFFSKKR